MDKKQCESSEGIDLVWQEGFIEFQSRKKLFGQMTEGLKDASIISIGLWGMAGIGKTKLAIEFGKKAKDDYLFDHVLYAVVSQNPNIRKIQGNLVDMLGVSLKGTSETDRATELSMILLGKGNVLIIMDDVWEEVNLANIGIPLRLGHKGCKIVITTRREQVCIAMHCQKKITFEVLNEHEGYVLFNKHARIDEKPRLHSKAKKIIKKCAGLALAIEIVGSALRNKSSEDYDDAIQRLSQASFVDMEVVDREIYHHIEWSVKYMKCKESEMCFLLCSLFPEDAEIDLEYFIGIVFGLRLFENTNSIEEARKKTLTCIINLLDASLLMPLKNYFGNCISFSKIHDSWNSGLVKGQRYMPCVKMHDIVRDVALWLSKKHNIFYMSSSLAKKQWMKRKEKAVAISIKGCPLSIQPRYPKLKVLLLEQNSFTKMQDDWFEMVNSLQVLGLSFSHETPCEKEECILPASIQHLQNLRTFFLCGWPKRHHGANDFSIIGSLKNLQILSLQGTHIEELPKEIGQLTSLRLLDLAKCHGLKKIPHKLMSSLTALEEFYTYSRYNDFQIEDDLLSELTSLPHLTAFSAKVYCAHHSSTLSFKNSLQRFTIFMCSNPKMINHFDFHSRNLLVDVLDCTEMKFLQQLLPQVESLNVKFLMDALDDLLSIVEEDGCFESLTDLRVQACYLDYLVNTTNLRQPRAIFSKLDSLTLYNLTEMTRLCKGPFPSDWMRNLTKIDMYKCLKFQNIVPHVIPAAPKLKRLGVWSCRELKHVYELPDFQHIENEMSLLLPWPEVMFLADLPELIGIFERPKQLEKLEPTDNENHDELPEWIFEDVERSFNSLDYIRMEDCGKVEEVFRLIEYKDRECIKEQISYLRKICLSNLCQLRCIWTGPQQNLQLLKLESIQLSCCDKLTSIFTPASARHLLRLRDIQIQQCGALEAIISVDEDEMLKSANLSPKVISFPKLERIKIESCGELRSILPMSVLAQGLPKLEIISISDCHRLEKVFGDKEETMTLGEKIKMNDLHTLELDILPSLHCFSTTNCHIICPFLQLLCVMQCPFLDMSFIYARNDLVHTKKQIHFQSQKLELLDNIGNTSEAVPIAPLKRSTSLECVELVDFHGVEELFDFSGIIMDQNHQPLSSLLTRLRLETLPDLNHIWKGPNHSIELKYLELVEVTKCPNLTTLFPSTIFVGALTNLKRLHISQCENLVAIVATNHKGNFVQQTCFSKLWHVLIWECPKLKTVFPLSMAQKLSQLECVVIEGCPMLEHVFYINEEQQRLCGTLCEFELLKLDLLHMTQVPRSALLSLATHPIICPCLTEFKLEFIDSCNLNHGCSRFANVQLMEPKRKSKLHKFGDIIPLRMPQHLMGFERLKVKNCEVEEIFDLEKIVDGPDQQPVLTKLRRLSLKWLPDLKCIWKGPTSFVKLMKLEFVKVSNCGCLKNSLFTHSIAQSLSSLESLYVYNCKELQHIMENEVEGESVIHLPKLKDISVQRCESLISIFPMFVAQRLPLLERMIIRRAYQLRQLFSDSKKERCDVNKEICLPKLSHLKLEYLPCLSHIFPASYVVGDKSFQKLQDVSIKNCNIEVLFNCVPLSHEKLKPLFVNLQVMKLSCLPNMKYIWKVENPQKCLMGLYQLTTLHVKECDRLKSILPEVQRLPRLEELYVKRAFELETIFGCAQKLFGSPHNEGIIGFPNLRIIQFEKLPSHKISLN